jgi:hypothetical protein
VSKTIAQLEERLQVRLLVGEASDEVLLAELDPVMPQDVVCGRDVEKEVWDENREQIGAAVQNSRKAAELELELAILAAVGLSGRYCLEERHGLIDALPKGGRPKPRSQSWLSTSSTLRTPSERTGCSQQADPAANSGAARQWLRRIGRRVLAQPAPRP